jgi:hypothetical protein
MFYTCTFDKYFVALLATGTAFKRILIKLLSNLYICLTNNAYSMVY